MVFPPINPVYLDPPNWAQQTNQIQGVRSNTAENSQFPTFLQPPSADGSSGGNHGSVRPGSSMVDRAKLAKLPQPEGSLKCPRCESTNTKFCYYNNYSLSQPRHFCKTCRRYWTSGGALRNVPVGGGCRRNKRSSRKRSRSKSPSTTQPHQAASAFTRSNSSTICTPDGTMNVHLPRHTPSQLQLSYMSHFQNISDYVTGDMQLSFGSTRAPMAAASGKTGGSNVNFQNGSDSRTMLSSGFTEVWRSPQVVEQLHHRLSQQQLPIWSNILEPSIGLFPYEEENIEPPRFVEKGGTDLRLNKALDLSASGIPQPAMVKVEENRTLDLPKSNAFSVGSSTSDHQVWIGSNSWNDLPAFTGSTTHLL